MILSYGIKIWTDLSSFLSQFTALTCSAKKLLLLGAIVCWTSVFKLKYKHTLSETLGLVLQKLFCHTTSIDNTGMMSKLLMTR